MKEEITVLQLQPYELGVIIKALNDFRNKYLIQEKDTTNIDNVLMKVIETPSSKKKILTRTLRKDERRY